MSDGAMTAAELLARLSVAIYEPPLTELRESERIADPADPLDVVMLALDFMTEFEMNGMVDGFLGNSTGRHAPETVGALRTLGCEALAAGLERILRIAAKAGMTHEAIQAGRAGGEEFAITSFEATHGANWRNACREIDQIADRLDFEPLGERLEAFVGRHRETLAPLVKGAG